MRKLLATFDRQDEVDSRKIAGRLARSEVRCHDGARLSAELHERLLRECERLALAEAQLAALEKARTTSLPDPRTSASITHAPERHRPGWRLEPGAVLVVVR